MRRFFLLVLLSLVYFAPVHVQSNADDDAYIRANRLGIAHISLAAEPPNPERYARALALGAGWNRWPLYWDRVEVTPGAYDWSRYDAQVAADLEHGLEINAILLGSPDFHRDDDRISGLNEPIFADGSDFPAPGKALNPANVWALYAYSAVKRYMPGGELDAEVGLPRGAGIRVWEVWNEPDFTPFWNAGIREYARLLKVASLAIKHADPDAKVMFGGLLYPVDGINWLAQVLLIYSGDPQAAAHNWYFDIAAVHAYGDPWRSSWLVINARETLEAYGLEREIWLNETGVPVWDDYPGPIWEPDSEGYATIDQQALHLIQSAAYAWAEGADVVIYHQLYDDCGDQPPGTNFLPHTGSLCRNGDMCFGDAFGLFRNPDGAICFSNHPQPNTPRPVTGAYRLLAEVFGTTAFRGLGRQGIDDRAITLMFERPETNERITVVWNRTLNPFTLALPANGENAQVVTLDGNRLIAAENGVYALDLPAAEPDNYPDPPESQRMAIGGSPLIVIEREGGAVEPQRVDLDITLPVAGESQIVPVQPDPSPAVISGGVNPTFDSEVPSATVNPLPETSPAVFTVSWRGSDDSGIESFLVWVRVDDGAWQVWQETAATSGEYTGEPGRMYAFSVWAVDLAGNWTPDTSVTPQAVTRVE